MGHKGLATSHDIIRSRRQARQLCATSRQPHAYVLEATREMPEHHGEAIVEQVATEALLFGRLPIPVGETYYLIASNVGVSRFYAVWYVQSRALWACSSTDQATRTMLIARIETHLKLNAA